MKTKSCVRPFTIIVTTATLIAWMTQLTSCGIKSDPTPSAQDAVRAKLIANNWTMQSVSVDGVDQTSVYAGLTIQFTATSFTTTNGKAVWPVSGTWSFASLEATTITRNDGIEVKVDIMDTTLKLTLTWTKSALGGGRVEAIKGVNVFNLVK